MRIKIVAALVVAAVLLADSTAEATLYGFASITGDVYEIAPLTGAATLTTSITELPNYVGLAFLDGQLYATDIFGDSLRLGTIDLDTGVFTGVSDQAGSVNWHGLAANENDGVLYSMDTGTGVLKSITATGVITSIGTGTGIQGRGMAYDDANGILYATGTSGLDAVGESSLYTINTNTGISTRIGSMGISEYRIGLAYDEVNGILYANESGSNDSLYQLNVNTGQATEIGSNGATGIDGLAWILGDNIIPEPTSLALWSGLAVMGLIAARRRKQIA